MPRTGSEEKPEWSAVPAPVREKVGVILGSPVARAMRIWGGYGPSPTYRLRLKNGNRAFLKAVYPGSNDHQRSAHDAELKVYRELLKIIGPWAPDFLGEFDLGDWRVMLLEDLGAKTAPPWKSSTARRVAVGLAEFHNETVHTELPEWLPRLQNLGIMTVQLWRANTPENDFTNLSQIAGEQSNDARRWLEEFTPALVKSAKVLQIDTRRQCLMHMDVRSDNLRLKKGQLRLFDWPHTSAGPPEFDAAAFAQSVEAEGGPTSETVMDWYAGHIEVDSEVLTSSIVCISGYFANQSWKPPIPGLPRIRSFQKAQLKVSLRWAARRLGLKEPHWVDSIPGKWSAS